MILNGGTELLVLQQLACSRDLRLKWSGGRGLQYVRIRLGWVIQIEWHQMCLTAYGHYHTKVSNCLASEVLMRGQITNICICIGSPPPPPPTHTHTHAPPPRGPELTRRAASSDWQGNVQLMGTWDLMSVCFQNLTPCVLLIPRGWVWRTPRTCSIVQSNCLGHCKSAPTDVAACAAAGNVYWWQFRCL